MNGRCSSPARGAEALADIGDPAALAVLQRTALEHPFGTVRQVARDALWTRGVELEARMAPGDGAIRRLSRRRPLLAN